MASLVKYDNPVLVSKTGERKPSVSACPEQTRLDSPTFFSRSRAEISGRTPNANRRPRPARSQKQTTVGRNSKGQPANGGNSQRDLAAARVDRIGSALGAERLEHAGDALGRRRAAGASRHASPAASSARNGNLSRSTRALFAVFRRAHTSGDDQLRRTGATLAQVRLEGVKHLCKRG